MSILVFLKKNAAKITKQSKQLFHYPVEKQKEYLKRFDEPQDNIERSFYQYRCQMKLNGGLLALLLNAASPVLILYYYLKKNDELSAQKAKAVFVSQGKSENIIPKDLKEKYSEWITIHKLKEYLTAEDKLYFKNICKRYPWSWHFLFKCLIKLKEYSYIRHNYDPKAIVVCGEYSFTSSLLTDYCEQCGILHINVMHGEKLFYIRDSFFHFHKCYVWNEYYKKLFISLRAENTQFIVKVPRSLVIGDGSAHQKEIDYTYYLGAETGEQLTKINLAIKKLQEKGFVVAIRPHPRYSNIEEIRKKFVNCIVEDRTEIAIEESVLRTKNVISLYSTVLNQAYNSNVRIVLDDLSNAEMFDKLYELQYVMLKVEHTLLSNEIKG